LSPPLCFLICALVPYFVVWLEFYQIFDSISGGQNVVYLFYSIYIAFAALVLVIAQMAIIQNYLHLCYEYYDWWWRTFFLGSGLSLGFLTTMTYHLLVNLQIEHATTLAVYMVIEMMVCASVALAGGAISVGACFTFNRHIYKNVKLD
jgi:transmembrane 9 superfamily member 2/4